MKSAKKSNSEKNENEISILTMAWVSQINF